METNNPMFKSSLDSNNLTNLIENNTRFKGNGSSIDVVFTNRKHSFKYTSSNKMGLSNHYYIIYKLLKSLFTNIEPKLLNYREYKIII